MNEYAVFKKDAEEEETTMMVALDDSGITGACRTRTDALYWSQYFQDSDTWKDVHLFDDHPLQSVFRSTYANVDFYPIEGGSFGDSVYDLMDDMEESGDIYMFAVPAHEG